MRCLKRSWLVAVSAALIGVVVPAARGDDDDSSEVYSGAWQLQVEPDDASQDAGAVAFEDAILVAEGYVSSEAFGPYGFAGGAVVESDEDDNVFGSTLTSSSQGTLAMVAQAAGGNISGQLVWQKADGAVMRYNFSGQRMHIDN